MKSKKIISEDLLSKVSGGVLDDATKEEIMNLVDSYKAQGVDLESFIKLIIYGFEDKEEAEAFIRNYWENGKIL